MPHFVTRYVKLNQRGFVVPIYRNDRHWQQEPLGLDVFGEDLIGCAFTVYAEHHCAAVRARGAHSPWSLQPLLIASLEDLRQRFSQI